MIHLFKKFCLWSFDRYVIINYSKYIIEKNCLLVITEISKPYSYHSKCLNSYLTILYANSCVAVRIYSYIINNSNRLWIVWTDDISYMNYRTQNGLFCQVFFVFCNPDFITVSVGHAGYMHSTRSTRKHRFH